MKNIVIKLRVQGSLIKLNLLAGKKSIDHGDLTISQDLDTLLIVTIDKLLAKNRIDRLSLKRLEIQGKMRLGAVSSMIIKTVKSGLES